MESQRALNEQEVANRLLKLQVQELQNKLKEKENQLTDANEVTMLLKTYITLEWYFKINNLPNEDVSTR